MSGCLRLDENHLRQIKDAIWCAAALSGKDPADVAIERRINTAGKLAKKLELLLASLAAQRVTMRGLDNLQKLRLIGDEPIRRRASPRIRRSLSIGITRGAPSDPTIRLLVWELARVYKEAGGKVAASENGAFAQFLRVIAEALPDYLCHHRGDRTGWLMRQAKAVPKELCGQLGR